MRLLDLIRVMRHNYLDDTGGSNVDWKLISEQDDEVVLLRWSNEELTFYINEAVDQVYRRMLPAQGHYPEFNITLQVDEAEYDLNPKILRILGARLVNAKRDLVATDTQQLWHTGCDLQNDKGQVQTYLVDYNDPRIRFYRIPTVVDTVQLFVQRLPFVSLSWDNNNTEVELKPEWQAPMLYHAISLAYLKDEANTYDPKRSDIFKAKFDSEFPETSAYAQVQKYRNSFRGVSYGGVPISSTRNRLRRNSYGQSCGN